MTRAEYIFPLFYFPPVSYLATLIRSEHMVFEVCETFPKQTWRNRCRILAANGLCDLIVPVKRVNGNHTVMRDVLIDNSVPWQRNHWRTIVSAYSSSPFFEFYSDSVESVFKNNYNSLVELNVDILKLFMKLTKSDTEIGYTDTFIKADRKSRNLVILRDHFSPKKPYPGSNAFPVYFQVFGNKFGFQPDLSFLDLLFSEGPSMREYLGQIPPVSKPPVSDDLPQRNFENARL